MPNKGIILESRMHEVSLEGQRAILSLGNLILNIVITWFLNRGLRTLVVI